MSAVSIITTKLKAHAPLTALTTAARIVAGPLPQGVVLPAIGVTLIDDGIRSVVSQPSSGRMRTCVVRVHVMVTGAAAGTAAGTGYPGLDGIHALVLAALPKTRGTVATFKVDSIVPAGTGPDLPTDAPATLTRSRDFIVRWTD